MTDAEACQFPEARTLLSARTVDLAAPEELPWPKARQPQKAPTSGEATKSETKDVEVTPAKGADILRHFISSLGPEDKSAQAVAEATRGHWGCETRHWERDQIWHEDQCLLRSPKAACALAMLRVATKALMIGIGQKSVTRAIEDARERVDLAISWIKDRKLGR